MPKNLSGGQRQRVAIGRAIVRDPEVFLFDEPLSNLDAALRVQTRIEIAKLHERLKSTMIYVTHDQVEAMTLADKIVVLQGGIIEQVGSPIHLYNQPDNMFVAGFIGSPKMNFFPASGDGKTISIEDGGQIKSSLEGDLHVGVRPEHLILSNKTNGLISGDLDLVEHLGEYALVHLTLANKETMIAKMIDAPKAAIGDKIYFTAEKENIHIFDAETTRRIVS